MKKAKKAIGQPDRNSDQKSPINAEKAKCYRLTDPEAYTAPVGHKCMRAKQGAKLEIL